MIGEGIEMFELGVDVQVLVVKECGRSRIIVLC